MIRIIYYCHLLTPINNLPSKILGLYDDFALCLLTSFNDYSPDATADSR